MHTRSLVFCFILLSTACFDCGAQTGNVTATWNGGGDGPWWTNPDQFDPTGSKWSMSGNLIPYNYPNTVFNGTSFTYFDVIIDDGSAVSVPAFLPMSISNLTMTPDSSVVLNDGSDFLLINAGDSAVNGVVDGGQIRLNNNTGSFLTELFLDGNITFTNGGRLIMNDSANNVIRGNTAYNPNPRMTLDNYTVEGGGNIGSDELSVTILANGLIKANTNTPLIIQPIDGGFGVQNFGKMQATDGGTLRLFDGGFDNSGGVIESLNTGIVEFGNATVRGGELAGNGTFRLFGPTTFAGPITNNAKLEIGNGHRATLDGSVIGELINNGEVALGPTMGGVPSSGQFVIALDSTLTGGGLVTMSNNAGNVLSAVFASGARLTNVDNTIRGAGTIGLNGLRLTNQGTIRADQATQLTIQTSDVTDGTINEGKMEAVNGGTLVLNILTLNNLSGQVTANNGTVRLTNSATITGGTVDLIGTGALELSNGTVDAITTNNSQGTIRTIFGGNNRLSGIVTNPTGGMIVVNDDTRLTINTSGTYNNAGTIKLDGEGSLAGFSGTRLLVDGLVTLSGGGDIEMTNSVSNTIESAAGNTGVLVNADHRIHGAGSIGRNTLQVTNRSLIEADLPQIDSEANGTIFIDPGAGPDAFINEGTLRATNGGKLVLFNGIYRNAGGLIEAQDGSAVDLEQAAEIRGGTLRTTGSGQFNVNSHVTFDGVGMTVDANVNVNRPGGRLDLIGSIVNQKSIFLNQSNLHFKETVTLSGGGNVIISDDNMSGLVTFSSSLVDRLINEDNTISGSGYILSLGIVNRGTIRSEGVTDLVYQISANGFDNQGNLRVAGPGELHLIGGPFTNSGSVQVDAGTRLLRDGDYVQTAGTTNVDGTLQVTLNRVIDIQGGEIGGNGQILGSLVSNGTIGAGNSVGILELFGLSTFSGNVEVELAGVMIDGTLPDVSKINRGTDPTQIEFDQINIYNQLNLADGLMLNISMPGGFNPQVGDFFDVLTANQINQLGQLFVQTGPAFEFEIQILTLPDQAAGTDRSVLRLVTLRSVPEPNVACLLGLLITGLMGRRVRPMITTAA